MKSLTKAFHRAERVSFIIMLRSLRPSLRSGLGPPSLPQVDEQEEASLKVSLLCFPELSVTSLVVEAGCLPCHHGDDVITHEQCP